VAVAENSSGNYSLLCCSPTLVDRHLLMNITLFIAYMFLEQKGGNS